MAKKSLHLINYTAFVIQLTINQMLSDCNGTRSHNHLVRKRSTAWKVSKYGVFSGPYFPVLGLNTGKHRPEKTPYLDTFHPLTVHAT